MIILNLNNLNIPNKSKIIRLGKSKTKSYIVYKNKHNINTKTYYRGQKRETMKKHWSEKAILSMLILYKVRL